MGCPYEAPNLRQSLLHIFAIYSKSSHMQVGEFFSYIESRPSYLPKLGQNCKLG